MKKVFIPLFALLAACNGNEEVISSDDDPKAQSFALEEDDVTCGEIPQSTLEFRKEREKAVEVAWTAYQLCTDAYQKELLSCIVATYDEKGCVLEHGDKARVCGYNRYTALNAPSVERCGAQVFAIPPDMQPWEFKHPELSTVDTDGDGLTDGVELLSLDSDPCADFSLDPCVPDAEVDSDGDGIKNIDDPAPGCPGTDHTPCV